MILELFKVVVKDKISTKKSCRCLFLYLVYIQSTCLEEYLFSLKKNVMSRFSDDSGAF